MSKTSVLLFLLAFIISGCTFSYEVLTPAPPATDSPTLQLTPFSTETIPLPVGTSTPTAVPVAPTLAPPTTDPIFFNGRAAATSNEQPSEQSYFPPGTKIVYVIWDYQNMRDGMQIRREWYLNGQPWLTREETWNFAKYGATGTMRDVSIHDEFAGLDVGTYHLRIYIDNVLQPLGDTIYAPISEWVSFEIGQPGQDSFIGYGSWDGKWGVEVYGGNQVTLKNVVTGETRLVVVVQDVAYVNWFKDSQHFLFIDRDHSEQKPGTTIGLRDHLWIVDVPSGVARRVYKGDAPFLGTLGPDPSSDGKYILGLQGSGYADGCLKDQRLVFFEVADDFKSAKVITQSEFSGIPVYNESVVYPSEGGYWISTRSYDVMLNATCSEKSGLGSYTFDLLIRTAIKDPSTGQPIPGDLGVGSVHGQVTNASGVPIANATVTCQQYSYTSSTPCSGSFTTALDGLYSFSNIHFHDTDLIKLTVQAAGYESWEISQSPFTTNDWTANIMLNKLP
jgi:hypothetical protein